MIGALKKIVEITDKVALIGIPKERIEAAKKAKRKASAPKEAGERKQRKNRRSSTCRFQGCGGSPATGTERGKTTRRSGCGKTGGATGLCQAAGLRSQTSAGNQKR